MSFQTAAAPTLRERSSVAITVGDEPPSRSFLAAGSVKSDGSAVHAAVAPTPVSRSGSHVKSPVAAQHAHEKHLHPTLPTVPEPDKTHKSGWVVATSHIVTAVVGAGVLGLPNAFAWLGWPSAIVLLTLMYAVTLWTSVLLADLFELDGVRHPTYSLLTQAICDKWSSLAVVISQRSNQILITIAYTITGAASIVTMEEANFKPANCPGGDVKNCEPAVSVWQATLMFGAVQLLLSQLPNLEAIWWVSLIGAGTSVGYSVIAFALSCYVATPENQGTLLGRQISTTTGEPLSQGDKAFGVLNAIGTVLFAYNFSSVLVEIQDTLAEPPASKVSMRKSCAWGITMSYLFYASVGFAGYWALGNNVPGDVLAGFADTDVPGGVITFANSLVLLHMFSAFQVYAQPVFVTIESALTNRYTWAADMTPLFLRLTVRSTYVCIAALIAAIMPFFSAIIGLVGALTFFVPAVYAPIMMWCKINQPARAWLVFMWATSITLGVMACFAIVGSMQALIVALSTAKFFQ